MPQDEASGAPAAAPTSSPPPAPSGTTHPQRRSDQFDDAPSTAYEYANGDRGQKSGVNQEQDAAIRGRPGDGLPPADRDIIDERPAITPRNPDGHQPG